MASSATETEEVKKTVAEEVKKIVAEEVKKTVAEEVKKTVAEEVKKTVAEEVKKVTLISSDGEKLEVDVLVAMKAETIKHMIEDDCFQEGIPVPNVTGSVLSKIITYCSKHTVEAVPEEELKAWDADYVKVDLDMLHDLLMASNYLNIQGLLDLCCQTVADMIKGKTPEEIRRTFNIQNDFTPEEEEEIRKQNQWAFE